MSTDHTRKPKMADFYDAHYARDLGRLSAKPTVVLELLRTVGPFGRILDLGCGDGGLTLAYASECKEILGVELALEACRLAHGSGLSVVRATLEEASLPLRDNAFDLVVAGEIIEHMTDTDHLLDEIARVLRPNGFCIVTTPNLASWYNKFLVLTGYQPYHTDVSLRHQVGKVRNVATGGSGHFSVFTLRALKGLANLHGLRPIEVRGCLAEVPLPLPARLADKAMAAFPDLSSYLIMLAQKTDGGGSER